MLTVCPYRRGRLGEDDPQRPLQTELGLPVRSIYIGVNMYASDLLLPHTRLLLALRRLVYGDDPEAASDIKRLRPAPATVQRRALASVRSSPRLAKLAGGGGVPTVGRAPHTRRGRVVIFDRHFFAADSSADGVSRPLPRRIHGFMLQHIFPKPSRRPPRRSGGGPLRPAGRRGHSSVRRKRKESRATLDGLPHCLVVDATRPPDEVVSEVATAVRSLYERRLQERRSGRRFVPAGRLVRGRRS